MTVDTEVEVVYGGNYRREVKRLCVRVESCRVDIHKREKQIIVEIEHGHKFVIETSPSDEGGVIMRAAG